MSIRDSEKITFTEKLTFYNIKQLKNIAKIVEKRTKGINLGYFEGYVIVKYNDRDSLL